jgi:hypothetical protein
MANPPLPPSHPPRAGGDDFFQKPTVSSAPHCSIEDTADTVNRTSPLAMVHGFQRPTSAARHVAGFCLSKRLHVFLRIYPVYPLHITVVQTALPVA